MPAALVAGCGFQLRRQSGMSFASLHVDAPAGGAVAERLRSSLARSKTTRLTAVAGEAEAVLRLGPEERKQTILSLSGAGRVTEYRLTLKLTYAVMGQGERVWAAPETIELVRDMTYDDTVLLAKAEEQQLLYRDMEESAALRIMRRLQNINTGNGH